MRKNGFTLIELSIVLVIIGLIIGGIFVGREMIDSSEARSYVSQIESFKTASNTFRTRYDCMPGDCPKAGNFGFYARGTSQGQGDGNGILEGYGYAANGLFQRAGETVLFWRDLSDAKLMSGSFSTATTTVPNASYITGDDVSSFIPRAIANKANYIYTYSDSGVNYYAIAAANTITGLGMCCGCLNSQPMISVSQSYYIDSKIDDGLPQSGKVMARYVSVNNNNGTTNIYWASRHSSGLDQAPSGAPTNIGANPGVAVSAAAWTCYDNGNNGANTSQYSMSQNSGTGKNCALSFQF